MEAVLDDHAWEVATIISGYGAKKIIKRSSCDLYKQTLASQAVDLEKDSYLKLLSRGGLFVPSRQKNNNILENNLISNYLDNFYTWVSKILAFKKTTTIFDINWKIGLL